MDERTCQACGKPTPRRDAKFCGRVCMADAFRGPETCSVAGCARPCRAKSLCSTHYNHAHQPNRHAKIEMPCDYCGQPCMKSITAKFAKRFCSLICRDLWRIDQPGDSMHYFYLQRPRTPSCPVLGPPLPRANLVSCHLHWSSCDYCSAIFCHQPRPSRRYCSRRCYSRAHQRQTGARWKARRIGIFERDGYICWMCERQCDQQAVVPAPAAATVDHITPRSLGGEDDDDNLATACFSCNTRRGASWQIPA